MSLNRETVRSRQSRTIRSYQDLSGERQLLDAREKTKKAAITLMDSIDRYYKDEFELVLNDIEYFENTSPLLLCYAYLYYKDTMTLRKKEGKISDKEKNALNEKLESYVVNIKAKMVGAAKPKKYQDEDLNIKKDIVRLVIGLDSQLKTNK